MHSEGILFWSKLICKTEKYGPCQKWIESASLYLTVQTNKVQTV